jgi:acyl carrier protein
MNSSESAIARFLLDDALTASGRKDIAADEPLIRSGLLDSAGLLQLAMFVEEHFDISVGDGELIPANFETIRELAAYIERKRSSTLP